mmetsp:Transcript_24187/g.33084  ORF Transcript_24187/g.33084 Transcript_24187/m.33084 type:complete len:444 (-) Transcript_24187:715-2046(-)
MSWLHQRPSHQRNGIFIQDVIPNGQHGSFLPVGNLARPPLLNPSWVNRLNWPSWNASENSHLNQSMRNELGMHIMVPRPGNHGNEKTSPSSALRPRSLSDQKLSDDYKSDDEEDDGEAGLDDECDEAEDGFHSNYPGFQRKRLRLSSTERLERSRERNRIHARKTRQRKKVHLQQMQREMEQLQRQNRELAQSIKERIAAIILLVLRSPESTESLLQMQGADILQDGLKDPDALSPGTPSVDACEGDEADSSSESAHSKISHSDDVIPPDLPSSSLKAKALNPSLIPGDDGDEMEPRLNGMILGVAEMAQMDIDLELLQKDRSQCTQQELDQIRRERNRMHAKRTRVRKKVQMEEIQGKIQKLAEKNQALSSRLAWLGSKSFTVLVEEDVPPATGNSETSNLKSSKSDVRSSEDIARSSESDVRTSEDLADRSLLRPAAVTLD